MANTESKKNSDTGAEKSKDKNLAKKEYIEVDITLEQLLTPLSIIVGAIIISVSLSLSIIFGIGGDVGSVAGVNAAECKSDDPYSDECLVSYAQEIGLNVNKFQECVESGEFDSVIDSEVSYASELGVGGTPTVFFGENDNGNVRGFELGVSGATAENLAELITILNNEGIDSTAEYWLGKQEEDYEIRVREFYVQQGETGDELEKLIETELNNAQSDFVANSQVRDLNFGDGVLIGNEDARPFLMEFSDYECPFCQSFAAGALQDIKSQLVDSNELLFVFRDLPLESIHPEARKLANATRCAGKFDKYIEMHDQIFQIN